MSQDTKPPVELLAKLEATAWDDYEAHVARAAELYLRSHKVNLTSMRQRWADAYQRFHEAYALAQKGEYP
jgi:hypothetical protein